MLIGTQRRARLRGIMVCLAAPSPAVAKVLRSTGLDRSFTICQDLSRAVAPVPDGAGKSRSHGGRRRPFALALPASEFRQRISRATGSRYFLIALSLMRGRKAGLMVNFSVTGLLTGP